MGGERARAPGHVSYVLRRCLLLGDDKEMNEGALPCVWGAPRQMGEMWVLMAQSCERRAQNKV